MVGVPRSRGCLNCRRSRVKCDETRPACQRCISKGKICEGYHRFSTFIHRSTDGTERRERTEESISSASNIAHSSQENTDAASHPSPDSTSEPHDTTVAVRDSASASSYSSLVDQFMAIWLPSDPANRYGPTIHWIDGVTKLADPDPPLHAALHALAANCVGVSTANSKLIDEGQQKYAEALGLLNSRLQKSATLITDQALAAARVLMMYEFYASPSQSVVGWDAHQHGLFKLAATRGPESFSTSFADALLLDIKNVNMIRTMQTRTRSNFLDPQWRRPSEPRSLYEVEHKLSELFFEMTVPLGQLEGLTGTDEAACIQRKALLPKFEDTCEKTYTLHGHLLKLKPSHMIGPSVDFWDLPSAILASYILLLHERACRSAHDAVEALRKSGFTSDAERWQLGTLATTYSKQKCGEIGARVYAAVEFCTRDEMGLYGAQKTLFPLRVLMVTSFEDDPYFERVMQLYSSVTTSKSLKHALDLDNLKGKLYERAQTGRSISGLAC